MPASVRAEFAKLPTMKTTLAVLLKRHYKLGARIVLGLENAGNGNEGVIAREGSVLHLAHLRENRATVALFDITIRLFVGMPLWITKRNVG